MNATLRLRELLEEAASTKAFKPDWTVPPGEILQEVIDELGITQAELARRMSVSQKHINQIVKDHVGITVEMALLLERETSVSARFWLCLEMEYRLFLARNP